MKLFIVLLIICKLTSLYSTFKSTKSGFNPRPLPCSSASDPEDSNWDPPSRSSHRPATCRRHRWLVQKVAVSEWTFGQSTRKCRRQKDGKRSAAAGTRRQARPVFAKSAQLFAGQKLDDHGRGAGETRRSPRIRYCLRRSTRLHRYWRRATL